MIDKCRQYLKACLNQVGIKQVNTSQADSSKHQLAPFAEIKFEDTVMRADGSLVARYNGPGDNERTLRRRIYERTEQAQVKIVHRNQAAAETARDSFINLLARRIDDGQGNAILITAWTGEVEEKGSILDQETAAFIDVKFEGGVYKDNVVKIFSMETDLKLEGEITEEV